MCARCTRARATPVANNIAHGSHDMMSFAHNRVQFKSNWTQMCTCAVLQECFWSMGGGGNKRGTHFGSSVTGQQLPHTITFMSLCIWSDHVGIECIQWTSKLVAHALAACCARLATRACSHTVRPCHAQAPFYSAINRQRLNIKSLHREVVHACTCMSVCWLLAATAWPICVSSSRGGGSHRNSCARACTRAQMVLVENICECKIVPTRCPQHGVKPWGARADTRGDGLSERASLWLPIQF